VEVNRQGPATQKIATFDVRLYELSPGCNAVITDVSDLYDDDAVARRLRELGFVPGESVRILARGPIARDPLAVQIGYTRFALRRAEAGRVGVSPEAGEP